MIVCSLPASEMGKEESPKVERRKTRYSCSAAASNEVPSSKTTPVYNPTVNDLAFGGEPLNFDGLLSSFPARRSQILQLMNLLGPSSSPMLPLFVYGGASTGKTTTVLQVFRHLNRPFVYVSCRTCYSPRILFESILNQLLLHRKNADNGYASAKRCEKPYDFVNFLREDVGKIVDNLKTEYSGKRNSNKLPSRPDGDILYLIIDNLELVREWDKSSSLLPFLFNLYDVLKLPNFGLIFISSSSPDTYYSSMGYIEPIPVFFPEYSEEDLRQVLIRNQSNQKLFGWFLDIVLRPFCRVTRRLDELSPVFSSLFQKYCEPLSDTRILPNDEVKRRLFSSFQPYISPYLNDIFWGPSHSFLGGDSGKVARQRVGSRNGEDFAEIDFHMSTSAKYLLISAFLASRNPATLDASLFDSTGGSDNRKRKRKASEKSMEQKESAEQESLMKGPGTFPLERLLAIFQCITSVTDLSLDEDEHGDGCSTEEGSNSLMSNVLLQLSTLCNANFIVKGASCPLEGSTRYRCTISEDLALKVSNPSPEIMLILKRKLPPRHSFIP
ncbi:Origin of replication complex subunit 5 [Linum perenne]